MMNPTRLGRKAVNATSTSRQRVNVRINVRDQSGTRTWQLDSSGFGMIGRDGLLRRRMDLGASKRVTLPTEGASASHDKCIGDRLE